MVTFTLFLSLQGRGILYEIARKTIIDRLGKGKICRADEDGSIEFITDGERLWVEAKH